MPAASPNPADRPTPMVDEEDCGGDPPCWEGRIADHRDGPAPAAGAGPADA
ncbi:MAG: hypothetical protein ACTHN0_05010 [Aquihabitans sp.]